MADAMFEVVRAWLAERGWRLTDDDIPWLIGQLEPKDEWDRRRVLYAGDHVVLPGNAETKVYLSDPEFFKKLERAVKRRSRRSPGVHQEGPDVRETP